jgi:SAM-dependent methyltransferase
MNDAASDLKDLYRLDIAQTGAQASGRDAYGERELLTLELLISEIGLKLPKSGKVVDLGPGDRFLQPAFARRNFEYTGLDYDTVNFEHGKFPVDSNSLDLVISLAVIEHIRNPGNFLSEIYRCLKPGGIVYLSTTNFYYDPEGFYDDPTHEKPYTPAALETILSLYKFQNVKTFPGLRCKPIGWYRGKLRFWKAFYLLPFKGSVTWAPSFLKGHARSMFGVGNKPIS